MAMALLVMVLFCLLGGFARFARRGYCSAGWYWVLGIRLTEPFSKKVLNGLVVFEKGVVYYGTRARNRRTLSPFGFGPKFIFAGIVRCPGQSSFICRTGRRVRPLNKSSA